MIYTSLRSVQPLVLLISSNHPCPVLLFFDQHYCCNESACGPKLSRSSLDGCTRWFYWQSGSRQQVKGTTEEPLGREGIRQHLRCIHCTYIHIFLFENGSVDALNNFTSQSPICKMMTSIDFGRYPFLYFML